MGKLPGLVNYSDDEDQSSSSSDEDSQQQQKTKQSQPRTTQSSSNQHTVTRSKPPSPQRKPISQPAQQPKPKPQNGNVESTSPAQGDGTFTQQSKHLSSAPTALIGDRSTQLKSILTLKALPGVKNWGIPPEPQVECDPERLEKIKHFLSLRQSGHRLNDHLQRNKAFRNPRIYAKLVEFVDLNETGSNFPPEDFDPASFPASSYIDGILETQKRLADEKAQQQAQGRSHLSFVSSSSNKSATAPSLDTNAKFAAAMANAAKIANKIAKPMPQQQLQQPPPTSTATATTTTTTTASSSSYDHHRDHNSHKRSSHHQLDRHEDKRRHR